jgi:hypothetical protein
MSEEKSKVQPKDPSTDKEIFTVAITESTKIFVTLLAFYLVEVITMIYTGHLGDSAIIAGSGLGSM